MPDEGDGESSGPGLALHGKARLKKFISEKGSRGIDWEANRQLADSIAFDELSDPVLFRGRHDYDIYLEQTLRCSPTTHSDYRDGFQKQTVTPANFEPVGSPSEWTQHDPHIATVMQNNNCRYRTLRSLSETAQTRQLLAHISRKQEEMSRRGFIAGKHGSAGSGGVECSSRLPQGALAPRKRRQQQNHTASASSFGSNASAQGVPLLSSDPTPAGQQRHQPRQSTAATATAARLPSGRGGRAGGAAPPAAAAAAAAASSSSSSPLSPAPSPAAPLQVEREGARPSSSASPPLASGADTSGDRSEKPEGGVGGGGPRCPTPALAGEGGGGGGGGGGDLPPHHGYYEEGIDFISTLMRTDPAKRKVLESAQPPETLLHSLDVFSALTADRAGGAPPWGDADSPPPQSAPGETGSPSTHHHHPAGVGFAPGVGGGGQSRSTPPKAYSAFSTTATVVGDEQFGGGGGSHRRVSIAGGRHNRAGSLVGMIGVEQPHHHHHQQQHQHSHRQSFSGSPAGPHAGFGGEQPDGKRVSYLAYAQLGGVGALRLASNASPPSYEGPPVLDLSDLWVVVAACIFNSAVSALGASLPHRDSVLHISPLMSHTLRFSLTNATSSMSYQPEQSRSLRKCPRFLLSKVPSLEAAESVSSSDDSGRGQSPLRQKEKLPPHPGGSGGGGGGGGGSARPEVGRRGGGGRVRSASGLEDDQFSQSLFIALFGLDLTQITLHDGVVIDYATSFMAFTRLGEVGFTAEDMIFQLHPRADLDPAAPSVTSQFLRSRVRVAVKRRPEAFPKLITEMNLHKLPGGVVPMTFSSVWVCLFGQQVSRVLRRIATRLEREIQSEQDFQKKSLAAKDISADNLQEMYDIFKLYSKSAGILTISQFRDIVPATSMRTEETDAVFLAGSSNGLMSFAQFVELLKKSYPPFNNDRSDSKKKGRVDEKVPQLARELRKTKVHTIQTRLQPLDRRERKGGVGKVAGYVNRLRDMERAPPPAAKGVVPAGLGGAEAGGRPGEGSGRVASLGPGQVGGVAQSGLSFKEVLGLAMQSYAQDLRNGRGERVHRGNDAQEEAEVVPEKV